MTITLLSLLVVAALIQFVDVDLNINLISFEYDLVASTLTYVQSDPVDFVEL
jgi:hypothetical protein